MFNRDGGSGDAMVLGKLEVRGPTNLDRVGQGLLRLQWVRVGVVWTFFLVFFFLFCLPLWETARYRLKYCLKEPLSPKQSTNRCFIIGFYDHSSSLTS